MANQISRELSRDGTIGTASHATPPWTSDPTIGKNHQRKNTMSDEKDLESETEPVKEPVHPAERHAATRALYKLWEERGEEFK